jgi:hypothetical protein
MSKREINMTREEIIGSYKEKHQMAFGSQDEYWRHRPLRNDDEIAASLDAKLQVSSSGMQSAPLAMEAAAAWCLGYPVEILDAIADEMYFWYKYCDDELPFRITKGPDAWQIDRVRFRGPGKRDPQAVFHAITYLSIFNLEERTIAELHADNPEHQALRALLWCANHPDVPEL